MNRCTYFFICKQYKSFLVWFVFGYFHTPDQRTAYGKKSMGKKKSLFTRIQKYQMFNYKFGSTLNRCKYLNIMLARQITTIKNDIIR